MNLTYKSSQRSPIILPQLLGCNPTQEASEYKCWRQAEKDDNSPLLKISMVEIRVVDDHDAVDRWRVSKRTDRRARSVSLHLS